MPEKPTSGGDQARIAALEEQVAALTRRIETDRFAVEIGNVMVAAATAGRITSPVTGDGLLKMIVETAAEVLSANAASLMLFDSTRTDLIFEVATGPVADQVMKVRVPVGHGIAGYVAASGQPLAVADADRSSAQAADIAERVGYQPTAILCVPMFYKGDVHGVLEVLDKKSGEMFDQADMQTLGAFANQAAVAIELSRSSDNVARVARALLSSIHGDQSRIPLGAQARIEEAATALESDAAYREALEIAALIHRIAATGDQAAASCRKILAAVAELVSG